jgi:hypothetical protein
MDPLTVEEHEGVVGFWYDDSTPEVLVREAEARAIALMEQHDKRRRGAPDS